jgi:hypothetical protein
MASPRFDIFDLVSCLQESARRGDWKSAGELAAALRQQTPPASREEIGEYLRRLKQALIVAKVSRANSAATLARYNTAAGRLNAAARFNTARLETAPPRQELGESADF